MERYNLAVLTKKVYESGFSFFTLKTIRDILEIKKESTQFAIIGKLIKAGLFVKIEKGKYLLKDRGIPDFALANFIYQPSYISFETALNFYGILSQFPYEICSTTVKKTIRKVFQDKTFAYVHIKRDLFWGYEKRESFLIAFPEKALLDQLYIAAKGYKKINLDEYDFRNINAARLKKYLVRYPEIRQFGSIIKKLKKFIRL